MSFNTIASILNNKMPERSALGKQITAAMVCEEFDKWLADKWGTKASDSGKALYYKDNVLTIASLSSVLSQEIKLHESEILEHLNTKFGITIKSLRYLT